AIAPFPAWAHAKGNGAGASFIDAPPIGRDAELLWSKKWKALDLSPPLLASPLGVVAGGGKGALVLDAETGDVRHDVAGSPIAIHAGRILVVKRRRSLAFLDLWTGDVLAKAVLEDAPIAAASAELVLSVPRQRRSELVGVSELGAAPVRAGQL